MRTNSLSISCGLAILIISRSGRIGTTAVFKGFELPVLPGAFLIRFRLCNDALPEFYRYFFNSPAGQALIRSVARGAAQQNINISNVELLNVPHPSTREQEKIADILSAYDDLIENNRRRIALLEEAARLLYREWFVHFRFPGHEHVRIIDGLPEGWKRRTLGVVAENYDRKRVPLSVLDRDQRRGEFPYYGAAGILDYIDDYLFNGRYLLMGEDGTVITERGTPLLQLVEGKFWVNNHAHVLRGKDLSTEHLYCALNEYKIQGHVTGVAQPKITQKSMNRIPVTVAPDNLRREFQDIASPLFAQRFALEAQNECLHRARDLLLPRLMNGEIAV